MANGELTCSSETPIPKSIALTISTNERKLLSYLGSSEAADNGLYQSPHEKVSKGSEVIHQGDNLANFQRAGSLHLYADLLLNLMVWTAQHQELRLGHPNGDILNAQPEHIRDAVRLHPWGVVYDIDRRILVSWGDVPRYALMDKRDLETGELQIPEQVVA